MTSTKFRPADKASRNPVTAIALIYIYTFGTKTFHRIESQKRQDWSWSICLSILSWKQTIDFKRAIGKQTRHWKDSSRLKQLSSSIQIDHYAIQLLERPRALSVSHAFLSYFAINVWDGEWLRWQSDCLLHEGTRIQVPIQQFTENFCDIAIPSPLSLLFLPTSPDLLYFNILMLYVNIINNNISTHKFGSYSEASNGPFKDLSTK